MVQKNKENYLKAQFNLEQYLNDINRLDKKQELINLIMSLPLSTNSYKISNYISKVLKFKLSPVESDQIMAKLMAENDILYYKILAILGSGKYTMDQQLEAQNILKI
jgi:hypothetical protein